MNITYQISGFREMYNWFPEEIYFAATEKQLEDYKKKYGATWVKALVPKSSPLVNNGQQGQRETKGLYHGVEEDISGYCRCSC